MSATSETKKLTTDPGVHYLAALVDEMKSRLDVCCPEDVAAPASEGSAPAADSRPLDVSAPASEDKVTAAPSGPSTSSATRKKKVGRRSK